MNKSNMDIVHSILCLLRNSSQRKHVFRWLRSLRKDYLFKKKQPWLVFDVIDVLNSLPLEGNTVFEYGSGGSTLFWLRHGAHLTSIEHDQTWYHTLRGQYLSDAALDYRLIQPQYIGHQNLDPADPDLYASSDELFSHHSFRNYCSQIDEFPNNYFDLILIDGRARPSCIKHAHKKVRIGGLLVLDNSDREYYLRMTSTFLRDFDRNIFRGVAAGQAWFTETSVFTRRTL
jgi:hypothetical protein